MVGSPCSPRDSQESSPTPQFKSTNSSVLSFLYCPTLTSIHDYWKNHSLTRWTFVGKVMSLTLCNPMDCSLTGSSIHGIFQARGLEWGAIAFSEALTCSCPQYPDSAYFLVLFPSFGKYQVVFSAAADVRVHPKMKKAKICGCHMAGELGRGG